MERFAGVDVGAPRKGFDVALLEGAEVVGLSGRHDLDSAASMIEGASPTVAGIDSPAACAAPGLKSRPGERELARAVCPIFYTPDEATVRSGNPFYEWVVHGLALYARLASGRPRLHCIEVFPSAAWTILAGPRAGRRKAQWSRAALERAGVQGLPARTSQDARDAVGAALVAQLYRRGMTLDYGGIAVPRGGAVAFPG